MLGFTAGRCKNANAITRVCPLYLFSYLNADIENFDLLLCGSEWTLFKYNYQLMNGFIEV